MRCQTKQLNIVTGLGLVWYRIWSLYTYIPPFSQVYFYFFLLKVNMHITHWSLYFAIISFKNIFQSYIRDRKIVWKCHSFSLHNFCKISITFNALHRFFFGCIVTAVDFHLFCLLKKKKTSSIEYLCYQLIIWFKVNFFFIYKGSYTRCKYDVFINSISCLSSNMHFCNIEILIYTQYNRVFRSYGKLLICNTKILMETNLFC